MSCGKRTATQPSTSISIARHLFRGLRHSPRHNRQVVERCGPRVVKRRSQLPDAYPERKCEDAGKLSGATWVAMVQALL